MLLAGYKIQKYNKDTLGIRLRSPRILVTADGNEKTSRIITGLPIVTDQSSVANREGKLGWKSNIQDRLSLNLVRINVRHPCERRRNPGTSVTPFVDEARSL